MQAGAGSGRHRDGTPTTGGVREKVRRGGASPEICCPPRTYKGWLSTQRSWYQWVVGWPGAVESHRRMVLHKIGSDYWDLLFFGYFIFVSP